MHPETQERLICLGVITSAHGVRGQVKIRSFTATPQDLVSYGELRDKSGKPYHVEIISVNNEMLIAAIGGISDRDAAEKLRNTELFVPRAALPATDTNEYYHEDLVGLSVFTADEKPYGQIQSIQNYGAGNIIVIKRTSGEEELVAFTKATFPVIDIKNKKVTITPPEIVEN